MIPLVASFLPKLLTNKWVIILVGILALIAIGFYIHTKAYNKGYKTGVDVTEAAHNVEKLKWIDKVSKIQREYEDTMNGILTSYNGQIAEYEAEIDKLSNQDPIIKTRYIHKYVPVETNCTIPKGFVDLHNTAAVGAPLSDNPTNVMDSTNVTIQDVGSTVAINYYEYNKVVTQLKALQTVVIDFMTRQKELVQ